MEIYSTHKEKWKKLQIIPVHSIFLLSWCRREAVEVRGVRQGVPEQGLVQLAPAAPPRREALRLRRLQEGLHRAVGAQEAPQVNKIGVNMAAL